MELMASDTYKIYSKGQLSNNYHRLLHLLYQPIIGIEAINLYQTLWSELRPDGHMTAISTHYRLTLLMMKDLPYIEKNRQTLEAIGLLHTYAKEVEDHFEYLYELLLPLDSQSFFSNDLLNILLYRSLGELDYNKTKYYFQIPNFNKNEYQEITKKFSDIFNIDIEVDSITREVLVNKANFEENKTGEITIDYNMTLFYTGLREFQIKKKSITMDVEKLIIQLGSIYDISPLEMRSLVKQSIKDDIVDQEVLRTVSKRYYEFESNGNFIQVHHMQPVKYKAPLGKDSRSKKIAQLESLSPYQILKLLQGGNSEPALHDLNIVESLMTRQKLEPGVINVIIELVSTLNDGRLPKAHMESIAGTFARNKVKTVEDALNEAKNYLRKIKNDNKEDIQISWIDKEKDNSLIEKTAKKVVNEKNDEDALRAMLSNLYER